MGTAIGGTAIVALARRLLVAIWRYVETGLVPAEAAQGKMEVFAGAVIAGDALTGFYEGVAVNLRR